MYEEFPRVIYFRKEELHSQFVIFYLVICGRILSYLQVVR